MRSLLPASLLLVLCGCPGPETGLDNTTIHGTITIPPVAIDEVDRGTTHNDSVEGAQGLGPDGSTSLTYRAVVLTGSASAFGQSPQGDYNDPDFYTFTPAADGTFTFWFDYDAGGAGDATADAVVYEVEILDLATYDGTSGILDAGSTDGFGGSYSTQVDVTGGGDYAVFIHGVSAEVADPGGYTLTVSGSAPGTDTVLVGAYPEGDPAVGSNPVGGTSAANWVFDEASLTWTGDFTALFVREVVSTLDTDGVNETTTVNEDVDTVYLMAATMPGLNRTPSAGALYSTQSLETKLTHGDITLGQPIVMDGVFPKVIGQSIAEALPDTTNAEPVFDDTAYVYVLNPDTLSVQDVGMLSGLGYVDVVDGSIALSGTDGWNGANDSDAYMFTVPESMRVSMVASWPNASSDIDFGIWGDYDPYGQLEYFSSFSDSYCLTGSDPEVCETVVTLEPDITYYLVALGYAGTGDEPYHVELEWLAP